MARIDLKLLDVGGAVEFGLIAASVGLVANLEVLYALVSEGVKSIQ